MRIALYHNLPSGGAKRALLEVVRRLSPAHPIDVYTLSSADHAYADIRPHVASHRVYDFRVAPLLASPFGRVNQLLRLADLQRLQRRLAQVAVDVAAGDYDVLFVHPCRIEKAPALLSLLPQVPTVYFCQEPFREIYETPPPRPYDAAAVRRRQWLNRFDPLPGWYAATARRRDRRHVRAAGRVLVNSEYMRQVVGDLYRVEPRVSYLGVDADWFRPLALPRQAYLFSVGSLTPLKGFDFLIESVALLPAAERLPLVIASNFQNPPERAFLEQLAARRGVTLQLRGNVSETELVRLYNQAAVTVYTPVREPFGLVPLESMACGTPVVSVAEGGTPETIRHEETGLLVPREPAACAAAIACLLAEPERAATMGREGRRHVTRHWTWDTAAHSVAQHLGAVARPVPITAP